MSGADIAAEIHAALIEAAEATGQSEYTATLTRPAAESGSDAGAGTPWSDAATGAAPADDAFTVTVLDGGTKTRYNRTDGGALIPRTVRVLTISAAGEAPQMGDRITLADGTFELAKVEPLAPGGEALLFEVEIAQ
ncbi:hypothetical protein [Pseudodonghicola flavimaris]|uniref:Minor capsid protein n=1 Tax=Pseudodonghicola flavimaris TaxID=3050036 RepID=A0ABT7EW31_9RHOB|nr:hypothetical protein [Pseudodonghicola flavimaris]MDK3016545.1 hypothetical protein [Pseudodonghicola flavimaris]